MSEHNINNHGTEITFGITIISLYVVYLQRDKQFTLYHIDKFKLSYVWMNILIHAVKLSKV